MPWHKIASQGDADALVRQCQGFHDGCFREAHVWTETSIEQGAMTCPGHLDTHVRTLFQLGAAEPSAIELRFDEVTYLHLLPSWDNCDSIIWRATLSQDEGVFHLRVYLIGLPLTGPPNAGIAKQPRDDDTPDMHIVARQVSWRDASEWMGAGLRYGPEDRGDNDGAM